MLRLGQPNREMDIAFDGSEGPLRPFEGSRQMGPGIGCRNPPGRAPVGNEETGQKQDVIYSLVASCRANGVNPEPSPPNGYRRPGEGGVPGLRPEGSGESYR